MTLPTLAAAAEALGVPLDDAQLAAFARYSDVLLDWNRRINLTAIREPEAVETLHFVDSIAGLAALPADQGLRAIDVGTGGGLPGLAMRLARPDLRLTLLDSVRKKTTFLEHLIGELGLAAAPTADGGPPVEVLTTRAEDLGRQRATRESWDVALARAVGLLPVLVELCLPLVRPGGIVIAWKKRDIAGELQAAGRAISILGGRRLPLMPVDLAGLPLDRQLVRIAKEKATPPRYPRLPGTPSREPLL